MTQTRTAHRRGRRQARAPWMAWAMGLGAAVLVTLLGVAVFALLMQWIRPSDQVIRVFNQVLKLLSIAVGVWVAVGKTGEGGLLRGALIGFIYMTLGVALYALLTGQGAPMTSYLADAGMGVASGGIVGLLMGRRA